MSPRNSPSPRRLAERAAALHCWRRRLLALLAAGVAARAQGQAADVAALALGARHPEQAHEEEEREEQGVGDGDADQRGHLQEEHHLAETHREARHQRGDCTGQHRHAHVLQGHLPPLRAGLIAEMPHLQVHMAEVNHIVDRQSDDDDARDGLRDPKVPALNSPTPPENGHHDGPNRNDGVEGHQHVTSSQQQNHECRWEADGKTFEEALDEGLLDHQEHPLWTSGLKGIARRSRCAASLPV
mmetsp:Transcript_67921/g.192769  ORF Transcript_67921/g.192769 Transcript_67921/m.192769 type:complete len:242 (+) Transcript_67921:227-952(+)